GTRRGRFVFVPAMLRVAVRNGRSSRMLETRPLLIFKTIVDVGSFTRAGVRLGLSQPAISQHIRALEREVGAPLLVRLGKSAKPTPPLRAPPVRVTEVGRDERVVIVPPQHPWAARRRVPAGELAGKPLVLYERQSQATDLIMRALLEQGVFPRITMEIDQMDAVKEMVRLGL